MKKTLAITLAIVLATSVAACQLKGDKPVSDVKVVKTEKVVVAPEVKKAKVEKPIEDRVKNLEFRVRNLELLAKKLNANG